MTFSKIFFYKNGEISKTAIFLSIATFITLLLWPFQALFAGTVFFSWWTVPAFSASAAVSVLGSLGALYAVNHGWVNREGGITPADIAEVRASLDSVTNSIRGDSDGN